MGWLGYEDGELMSVFIARVVNLDGRLSCILRDLRIVKG